MAILGMEYIDTFKSNFPPLTNRRVYKRFYITKNEITITDEATGQVANSELYLFKEDMQVWVMDLSQASYFKNYALAQGYIEAELPDGDYSVKLIFHKGEKKKK